MLIGSHHEDGAIIDYRQGISFNNYQANKFNESQFNLDKNEAEEIFNELEIMTGIKGFSAKAVEWMITVYKNIVVSLDGVKKPEDVVEIR